MTFQQWFHNHIKDKNFGSDAGLDHLWTLYKEIWDVAYLEGFLKGLEE